jgi:hypothetical protein
MPSQVPTAQTENGPEPRSRFWARFWESLRSSLGGVCC